ncbi:hypothetical protein B0H14DRAFT_2636665 [Mycena olivaceomarginata]|nr:hypothetical protein B0H14DRAFT_2636665 [Mycena olivaceomarginata]
MSEGDRMRNRLNPYTKATMGLMKEIRSTLASAKKKKRAEEGRAQKIAPTPPSTGVPAALLANLGSTPNSMGSGSHHNYAAKHNQGNYVPYLKEDLLFEKIIPGGAVQNPSDSTLFNDLKSHPKNHDSVQRALDRWEELANYCLTEHAEIQFCRDDPQDIRGYHGVGVHSSGQENKGNGGIHCLRHEPLGSTGPEEVQACLHSPANLMGELIRYAVFNINVLGYRWSNPEIRARQDFFVKKMEGCRIVEAGNTKGVGQTELRGAKNDRTIVWSVKSSH